MIGFKQYPFKIKGKQKMSLMILKKKSLAVILNIFSPTMNSAFYPMIRISAASGDWKTKQRKRKLQKTHPYRKELNYFRRRYLQTWLLNRDLRICILRHTSNQYIYAMRELSARGKAQLEMRLNSWRPRPEAE